MTEPWPVELRLAATRDTLVVTYEDGQVVQISATLLRVESPSAEVQGHRPADKKIVTGKENVRIVRVEPVGNYAARLVFDDGHDTGLFTWAYLHRLGVTALQAG